MESTLAVTDRARRPGGRTADVTRRINDSILALLAEGGVPACTFSNVAERAGVERSTLYRRYPDRWEAMIDAIIDFAEHSGTVPQTLGSFAEDLRFILMRMGEILATPVGPALWAVGAALRGGAAPQHADRFWQGRVAQVRPIIEAAIERGELAPDVDVEEVFAFAAGAIHFRMLVIGKKVDARIVDRIVDRICELYCLSRSAAAGNGRGRTAVGRG